MCGQRQGGGKEMMLSRLKEKVEELEEDLKRQTQMNGISLNSCITKSLQSSKSPTLSEFTAFSTFLCFIDEMICVYVY